jgi:hypothetical protein
MLLQPPSQQHSTPLVLFCYRRHDLLKHVLEALENQSVPIPLLIAYIDGPRKPEAQTDVDACRVLLSQNWRGALSKTEFMIRPREQNMGCRNNIRWGLEEVFQEYDRAIILEEDLVPNPHFYASLERLLTIYQDVPHIASVSGYSQIRQNPFFNTAPTLLDALETSPVYQSPLFACWGWGSWQDRWQTIGPKVHQPASGATLLQLPFKGAYAAAFCLYLTWLLKTIDSWATPFQVHSILQGFEHIGPRHSMIRNIGFHDKHAEHTHSDEGTFNHDFVPEFTLADETRVSSETLQTPFLASEFTSSRNTVGAFLQQLKIKIGYKIQNLVRRRELHLGRFYYKF